MDQQKCKHTDIRSRNKAKSRFQCHFCDKWFNDKNVPDVNYRKSVTNAPKVLLFDLETAPLPALVFNCWNQNISMSQLGGNFWIITWSAKWLNDSKTMSGAVTPKEALKRDDKRIVRQLWNLFNDADILIAHNAKKFDIKHSNTRFWLNGLKPPTPYLVIDTLLEARKNFYLPHNKLDFLAQILGIEMKKETTMKLWVDCLDGDAESLDFMQKYNNRDVSILEEIYLKMLPWIKSHPNYNLFTDVKGCHACGAPFSELKKNGFYTTTVNKYQSYQCKCGSFTRIGKSNKKSSLRSLAR